LANHGNTTNLFSPVSLPIKYHHGHLISIIPLHVAQDLEWYTTNVDPAQLEAPGIGDPPAAGKEDKTEAPLDHIHWTTTSPADEPKLMVVHVLLPLPTRIKPPIGINLCTGIFPANLGYCPVQACFKAMKYLALNNASVSLLFANGLFTIDTINPNSIFAAIGYPLDSMIEAPFTSLNLDDPHHGAVLTVMREVRQHACFHLSANQVLSTSRPTNPGNTPIITNPVTPVQTQPQQSFAANKIMFQALFAAQAGPDTTKLTLTKK
jgi:hypothetical protein